MTTDDHTANDLQKAPETFKAKVIETKAEFGR